MSPRTATATRSELNRDAIVERALTVMDNEGPDAVTIRRIAQEFGVRFSRGDAGRALHALDEIEDLIESGRLSVAVAQTFRLADIADAHRAGDQQSVGDTPGQPLGSAHLRHGAG